MTTRKTALSEEGRSRIAKEPRVLPEEKATTGGMRENARGHNTTKRIS